MGLFNRKNAQSAEDQPAAEDFSVRLPKQASSMAPEGVWTNAGELPWLQRDDLGDRSDAEQR